MATAAQVEALWNGLTDNSGSPLGGGKVYTYLAGSTSPVALFTSSDKGTSATNPLILDGYGRAQVWADGAYKFVVKDASDVTLYTLDNLIYGYETSQMLWGGLSTGTANAQVVNTVTSTSYSNGRRVSFIAGYTNTGPATLKLNDLAAVPLLKGATATPLGAGDIVVGRLVSCVYYGGSFVLEGWQVFGDGTADVPSYNFNADPDTGMFRPADNTLGFSTAGVERLRVLSDGNVGIGTTTAGAKVQVTTANAGAKGLIVKGSPLQTANLLEMQDGSGTPLLYVNSSGQLDVNNQLIKNVATPLTANDAATKAYVDGITFPMDIKNSCRVASTANIVIATGLTNGTVIDGVTVATGNRVLLKNQTNAAENGIYVVVASGAASRAADANSNANVHANMFVFVSEGTTQADTQWVLTTNDTIVLGTTNLTFAQFGSAPGTGLNTLNTLSTTSQSFATGTSGTDFAISSVGSTHTFNIPDASLTARGLITTGTQTIAGAKTFSGVVSVSDGVEATPAITFSADTNTGLFRPTADAVALSTGGAERVRVTSAGYVGIGTAAPARGIHLFGADSNGSTLRLERSGVATTWDATVGSDGRLALSGGGLETAITSTGQIRLTDGSAAAPVLSFSSDPDTGVYRFGANQIGFALGGITRGAFLGDALYVGNGDLSATPTSGGLRATNGSGTNIAGASLTLSGGQGSGTGAGGAVVFQTSAAGTSGTTLNALTERMRIDSAGNVGIGTTAPGAKLDVNAASSSEEVRLRVGSNNKVVLGSDGTLKWGPAANAGTLTWDTGRAIIHSQAGQDLTFGSGSTVDRMRITSTGEVGIGRTPSSGYMLDIDHATDTRLALYNAGTRVGILQAASSVFSMSGVSTNPIAFNTNGVERMRITSAGDVGVNASTITSTISAGNKRIQIQDGTNAGPELVLYNEAASDSALSHITFGGIRTNIGASARISANRLGNIIFGNNDAANGVNTVTERMRIKPNGQVRFIPLTADPAGAEDGDVYYNSTTNKLRVRAAGAWVDLH